jgi:hypothetical protein
MNDATEDPRPLRGSHERLIERLGAYLRSRDKDHWLMFAAGLVLGIVLG